MGLRSPFGNGPSGIPNPVPGNMTLSGLQQSAAMSQTVNIPKMVGAGFVQPQGGPQPSPSPSPSSEAAPPPQGKPDAEMQELMEMKDLQDAVNAKKLRDQNNSIFAKRAPLPRDENKKMPHGAGEMIGGTAGAIVGALAGSIGEVAGAGAGSALGEKAEAWVRGEEQPSLDQSLMTAARNAAGVGIMKGLTAGVSGIDASISAASAAKDEIASRAAAIAAQRLKAVQEHTTVPPETVQPYQSGEGTELGAQAAITGNQVANKVKGEAPQNELFKSQAVQENAIAENLKSLQDLFPQQIGRPELPNSQPGTSKGSFERPKTPGKKDPQSLITDPRTGDASLVGDSRPAGPIQVKDIAQNAVTRMNNRISTAKQMASESFGAKKFDAAGMAGDIENTLKQAAIVNDKGAILPDAHMTSDERQLVGLLGGIKDAMARDPGALGSKNPLLIQNNPTGPIGKIGSSPGGFPGAENMGGPRVQPGNVSGVNQPAGKIALMPPNEAGVASSGITFDYLDRVVSKIQDIAAANKSSATKSSMQRHWNQLSKDMTTSFHDVIRDKLMPINPEAADLVKRAAEEYSAHVDLAQEMTELVQQNPAAATNVYINANNSSKTAGAFNFMSAPEKATVSRQFLANAYQDSLGASPNGVANAEHMLNYMKAYEGKSGSGGNGNLDIVLGDKKDAILKTLETIKQLQNTQMKPGATPVFVEKLVGNMSKAGLTARAWGGIQNFFEKGSPLADYIGSADFQSKLVNKSRLFNAAKGVSNAASTVMPPSAAAPTGVLLNQSVKQIQNGWSSDNK